MNSRRNIDILIKMVEYCDEITEAVTHFGDSYDALLNSKIYKNATAMCILQIGELAGHLSDDFKAAYPEMPWRDIKSMRNVAAHRYGDFDLETLWGTIKKNIPDLRCYCEKIISQNQALNQNCVESTEPDNDLEQEPGHEMKLV